MEFLKTQGKVSQSEIISKINEMITIINKSSDRRGPKSVREMSDDDARRVLFGDMKDIPHKKSAEDLNLSYAQVYSCRKNFTFKHIHKEMAEKAKKLADESANS
jgi:hypothetical protein